MPEIIHVRPFAAHGFFLFIVAKRPRNQTDAAASIEFPPLNNALIEHGISDFYESGDVSADHEIAGLPVLFRSVP